MEGSVQTFVTEDMTFVTVLMLEGIHYEKMINQNGGCRWVYNGDSIVKTVVETLAEYNNDQCFVEPREFTRKLGMVRQEMYRFLKYKPPRVRAVH